MTLGMLPEVVELSYDSDDYGRYQYFYQLEYTLEYIQKSEYIDKCSPYSWYKTWACNLDQWRGCNHLTANEESMKICKT